MHLINIRLIHPPQSCPGVLAGMIINAGINFLFHLIRSALRAKFKSTGFISPHHIVMHGINK